MFRSRIVIAALVLASLAILLAGCTLPGMPSPTASPGLPRATPTATRLPTPTITPLPVPTPSPTPGPLAVWNTDGMGVYIRRTPHLEDKIKAWPDSTVMQVVGPDTMSEGRKWCNVKDPDGTTGWIPAEYLVPLDELPPLRTAAPSPTKAAPVPSPTKAAPTPSTTPLPELPPPQELGPVGAEGKAELTIVNDTPYVLTLEFQGPIAHTVSVERCGTCKVYSMVGPMVCPKNRPEAKFRLPPGTYQVVASVDDPTLSKFAGEWTLKGDVAYGLCFFKVSR